MDRVAWKAYSLWSHKESDMTERLNTHTYYYKLFYWYLLKSQNSNRVWIYIYIYMNSLSLKQANETWIERAYL